MPIKPRVVGSNPTQSSCFSFENKGLFWELLNCLLLPCKLPFNALTESGRLGVVELLSPDTYSPGDGVLGLEAESLTVNSV